MPRVGNPAPQYLKKGLPVAKGKMFYFKSQTNDALPTFKDILETIPNTHPVDLDDDGRLPNVFFTGTAKQILNDKDGIRVFERDPVGGENITGDFSLFDPNIIYSSKDKVKASNGKFYLSLSDDNQGNEPATSLAKWTEIRFIRVYNALETYALGQVVQEADGSLWRSLIASNLGNTPNTSPTKWLPSILGVKVPETITLESRTTTVIPQTGGGNLTALVENELRDANTYTLPLANSILANQTITISLPDRFSASQPTVQRAGTDTITDKNGTDTSILFDAGSIEITLTSDAVSNWDL